MYKDYIYISILILYHNPFEAINFNSFAALFSSPTMTCVRASDISSRRVALPTFNILLSLSLWLEGNPVR